MSDNIPPFRSVMRGWDPAQVEATFAEMNAALKSARQEADAARREAADRTVDLNHAHADHEATRKQLDAAGRRAAELEEESNSASSAPTYESFGARIGKILQLADQEATSLRATAQREATQHRDDTAAEVAELRAAAERYSEDTRSKADVDAAAVLEDARRRADEIVDDAGRAATARREEAEALYEAQRAKVSAAAADFETTLAARRDKAAEQFSTQLAAHEQSLADIQVRAATLQQEAEAAHAQAHSTAAATLEAARAEAAGHVQSAKEQAERIRHDSERELTAATARRDSINSQLANVRQMLATLGGAALAHQVAPELPLDDHAEPAAGSGDAEPVETGQEHDLSLGDGQLEDADVETSQHDSHSVDEDASGDVVEQSESSREEATADAR